MAVAGVIGLALGVVIGWGLVVMFGATGSLQQGQQSGASGGRGDGWMLGAPALLAGLPRTALDGQSLAPGAGPSISIPLGRVAERPTAYVLRVAQSPQGWRVAGLDGASAPGATDTLTLTVVLPWSELDRLYRHVNVVLR